MVPIYNAGMIWYRGKGLYTFWIFAAGLFFIPGIWHLLHGQSVQTVYHSRQVDMSMAVGIIVSGIVLIPLGLYLNKDPNRPVLDRQTGKTVRAGAQHTMYDLRMEYWGGIILVGGLYMAYRMMQAHAA